MKIDVTTTAMPRPELLDKTYSSFVRHTDIQFDRLFLNVDSFPDMSAEERLEKSQACIDVAKKYFHEVISNITEVGCFPAAVKWCWQLADTDYILHLEDDWELFTDACLSDLLPMFTPDIYQVSLRAYARQTPRFMLCPSLIRQDCYKAVAENLPADKNPEVWIRLQNRWKSVTYPAIPYDKIIIKDLGRDWLRDSKWVRCHNFEDRFLRYDTKTEKNRKHGITQTNQAILADRAKEKYASH